MQSLLTNTRAMSARSALAVTQRALARMQDQVSSGLRIASASDNPAYWSIATSMKTRVGDLEAADDGLDLTYSVVSTASAAMSAITTSMQGIMKDLVTSQEAGVDIGALDQDISARQSAIVSAARGATFNGVNLLVNKYAVDTTEVYDSTYDEPYADYQAGIPGTFTGTMTQRTTAVDAYGNTYAGSYVLPATSYYQPTATLDLSSTAGANPPVNYGTETTATHGTPFVDTVNDGGGVLLPFDPARTTLFSDLSGTVTKTIVYNGQTLPSSTTRDSDAYVGATVSYTFPMPADTKLQGSGIFDSLAALQYDFGNHFVALNSKSALTLRISDADLHGQVSGAYHDRNVRAMITTVANALDALDASAAYLGTVEGAIDSQKQVNQSIVDAIRSGIGGLVDADMNGVAARLAALQTQQSLGQKALAMANDDPSIVAKLFGG